MAIQPDKTMQLLQKSLDLRMTRQQLLASNLANVDTPNYRPRDLEFEGFLKEATNTLPSQEPPLASPESERIVTADPAPDTLDGNRVELDETVSKISDNATRYNTALELMRRKMAILSYAATNGAG